MDAPPDHYATLGLDRRCTFAQIRAAYRLLSKRHHPDVNGNSAASIAHAQEINAAHETLCDPARRRAYDRELDAVAAAPPRAQLDHNLKHEVSLRLDEFLRGTTLEVRIHDPGNPDGPETFTFEVPPNTAPNTRLRLDRTGAMSGGTATIRLRLRPHPRFKARGSDLRTGLRISTQRAATGGTEAIPGPLGPILRVVIPPKIARGETLTIRGEGLPKPRGGRGDLQVRVTYRPEVRITRTSR